MNGHFARRGLLVAIAALVAFLAPAHANASTVTLWNAHTNTAIAAAGQDGRLGVIHLAMVHGAMFDAVNAIDGGYEGYLISGRLATPFDSQDAAAATAAYRVLLNVFPAQQTVLDAHYAASLAPIPAGTAKTRGIAVGEAAAAAMIAARTADGRFGAPGFAVGLGAGQWRPVLPAFVNDPIAWLKDIKPFLIESSAQFRSAGPYELTSRKYAKEFDEVKELGSLASTSRTADQTAASRYWANNPVRNFNRIVTDISTRFGLSTAEDARLFAMVYLALADTFISVWDDKAHWGFWRPITAIREAAGDGNPRTQADPAWLPLIANPPYPDHPSGASGVGAVVCAMLAEFLGTNKVAITNTNDLVGITRSWSRIPEIANEIVLARVWSGIHFLNADEDGAKIGEQVANYGAKHYFQPVDDERDDDD